MISIIVPVYNMELYIRRCIESIITQSYRDWELILVDDGSYDRSGKICDEYAMKDERIRAFHKKNGGVSSARNMGLEKANGEWVSFVDADDYLDSDTLDKLFRYACYEFDCVIGGYRIVNEQGDVTYEIEDSAECFISRSKAIEWMYKPEYYRYLGYICSKLYKRKIIDENHLRFREDIFFNEDRLFAVEYFSMINGNIRFFSESVYNIVEHPLSALASLRNGYNKKYVTDFDAFVLMKSLVKRLPEASELIAFADMGIIKSYDRNHKMMFKYNDYSARNHWHMVWGMIKASVFIIYLKQLVIPIIMFVFPRYFCRRK